MNPDLIGATYAVTLVQITARHRWMPIRTNRRGEVVPPVKCSTFRSSFESRFIGEERYVYRRVMRLSHALQRSAMCIARANRHNPSPNIVGWVERLTVKPNAH